MKTTTRRRFLQGGASLVGGALVTPASMLMATPSIMKISQRDLDIGEWTDFYLRHFGLRIDLWSLDIPPAQDPFTRLLIVPAELTLDHLLQETEKLSGLENQPGPSNMVSLLRHQTQPRRKPYAVRVCNSWGPNIELAHQSGVELHDQGISGINLMERLLLGIKIKRECGIDIDPFKSTMCTGSIPCNRPIPCATYDPALERVVVHWIPASVSHHNFAPRLVQTV